MRIEEKGRAFLRANALKDSTNPVASVSVSFAVGALLDRIEKLELEIIKRNQSQGAGE